MHVSATDAEGRPTDLGRETRREMMERISKRGAAEALPGPDAARSQDFLYDEFGLPG